MAILTNGVPGIGAEQTVTLTNKTLSAPTISNATFTGQQSGLEIAFAQSIVFEGTTADGFETTLSAGDPTADRTVTLPNATTTLVGTDTTDTLTNKTLTAPTISDPTFTGTTTNINTTNLVVEDKNIIINDVTSPSDVNADGGGISLNGATTKSLNWVDATDAWTSSEHFNLASGKSYYVNGTLLKDVSETLTNKTLTTPVISSISNTGTLTLPTSTDTLVGRATTDTLTNKTLTSPALTTPTISTYTTAGDLVYGSGSGGLTRLGIGTTGQTLTVTAGVPAWGAAAESLSPFNHSFMTMGA